MVARFFICKHIKTGMVFAKAKTMPNKNENKIKWWHDSCFFEEKNKMARFWLGFCL